MARPTLNFGVLVQPYRAWEQAPGKRGRRPTRVLATTTADVAHILEDKYGIMSAFYRVHKKDVEKALVKSLRGSLEALMMGRRVEPFGSAMSSIEARFKTFISSQEAEHVGIHGTPTKAALRGVNHRLVHPYRRSNPRRPSFRDTGLYQASFKSWVS